MNVNFSFYRKLLLMKIDVPIYQFRMHKFDKSLGEIKKSNDVLHCISTQIRQCFDGKLHLFTWVQEKDLGLQQHPRWSALWSVSECNCFFQKLQYCKSISRGKLSDWWVIITTLINHYTAGNCGLGHIYWRKP